MLRGVDSVPVRARMSLSLPRVRVPVMTGQAALEARARELGVADRLAGRPALDMDDCGSAVLMDALGETSPTTDANVTGRLAMCRAYEDGWHSTVRCQYRLAGEPCAMTIGLAGGAWVHEYRRAGRMHAAVPPAGR